MNKNIMPSPKLILRENEKTISKPTEIAKNGKPTVNAAPSKGKGKNIAAIPHTKSKFTVLLAKTLPSDIS